MLLVSFILKQTEIIYQKINVVFKNIGECVIKDFIIGAILEGTVLKPGCFI